MRLDDKILVKSNLRITVRERGKITGRRQGHNIWLNIGRGYLASLICYSSYSGPTPERDDRVRYMGVGIGGTSQSSLSVANSAPLVPPYAGTNVQTDTDPTVTRLERPVRVSGGSSSFPYNVGDVWLAQVQAPVNHPSVTQSMFVYTFAPTDVSYSPFLVVPLSEIALFTNAANPNVYNNNPIAYDTFEPLSKTSAFSLEVDWTLSF
jgi:hypothetical protein